MAAYPRAAFAAYASGGMTREAFKTLFHSWQRAHGIDYTCRGTRIGRFAAVTYRGVGAVIDGGSLTFVNRSGGRLVMDTAGSLREFRRKVDFAKCGCR